MKIIKPSIGNVFLHRSVYLHDGVYYVDAIHVFPGFAPEVYSGGEVEAFDANSVDLQPNENTRLAKDVVRFARLSNGFLCQHPENDNVIGDIRYGMLPTSKEPLWGIKINPVNPEEVPTFVKFRKIGEGDLDTFYGMLFRCDSSIRVK